MVTVDQMFREYLEVQSQDPDSPTLLQDWYGTDDNGDPIGTLDDLKNDSVADYIMTGLFAGLEKALKEVKSGDFKDIDGLMIAIDNWELDSDIESFIHQVWNEEDETK
jgi:hypothetical protein